MITRGLEWDAFWRYAGFAGLAISATLFVLLPKEERRPATARQTSITGSLKTVFLNPQSILCGLIAGLLFIPTTIFDMTWGVRFLQEGRGREYEDAVRIAAAVPFGWMIGCPLLGFLSDRIGRRKPVILGSSLVLLAVMAWALFGVRGFFSGAPVGIVMGIASGAAMLPYSIIKEVNPPELGGSATGVVNFINFTFSALLGPVFGRLLLQLSDGDGSRGLEHYQVAFQPMLLGIVAAMVLTFFLKETGAAARRTSAYPIIQEEQV
jgi:MFS family permease